MKVSGFTIIRNAILMDYPVIESIKSLLPLVDEMIVALGQSDDNTKEHILSINDPKIKVIDTYWDTTKNKGGLILSEKTNEALSHCSNDWCFYLQGDEVLHEEDYPLIRDSLSLANKTAGVSGLLFKYIHFYGSHSVVASSRKWYRNEIRVIKKSSGVQSVADAQGFRIAGEKVPVISSGARVFHYGWVKPPKNMGQKKKLLDRLWHGNKKDKENDSFRFQKLYGLRAYNGSHPQVMEERIKKQNWHFDSKRQLSDWTLKDLNLAASDILETLTGYRIGEYKPYKLVKREKVL